VKVEARTKPEDSTIGQWAMIFALLLGVTLWIKDGTASGPGQMDLSRMLLLATTCTGAIAAFRRETSGLESMILKFFMVSLVILSGALTLTRPPGYDVAIIGLEDYQAWVVLRGMATALFLAAFFCEGRIRGLLLVIGLCFLGGSLYWTISHAKNSTIDVVHVFRAATKQLENGKNPYSEEMPRIYPENSPLTHKDEATGKPLSFGFVYPLGTLIGGAIGEIIFGDYRFLFSLIFLAGLLLLSVLPSFRAGLTFLFPIFLYPRIEFIFERGWADGLSSGLSLLAVATSYWLPWLAGIILGAFLATKPYFLVFWPSLFLAWSKGYLNKPKLLGLGILTLPIFFYLLPCLVKPSYYFWSIFFINIKIPPRPDSLSFFPFWDSLGSLACFIVWIIAFGRYVVQFIARKDLLEFLLLAIWLLFGVFLFAKSAFMNYYFNILVLTSLLMGFYKTVTERASFKN